jgi:hypothetical protein
MTHPDDRGSRVSGRQGGFLERLQAGTFRVSSSGAPITAVPANADSGQWMAGPGGQRTVRRAASGRRSFRQLGSGLSNAFL